MTTHCTPQVRNKWNGDITKWLKSGDMFGMKIGLTHRGSPLHRTLVGTFVSLFLWIYTIVYGAQTFIVVWRRDTAKISTSYLKFDIDNAANGFQPAETGFDFGFGFAKKLPKNYGSLTMEIVTAKAPFNKNVKREPITDVKPCGEEREKWFDSSSKYDAESWPFNNLICSGAFTSPMYGGYFSPNGTQYVHLNVEACLGGPKKGCAPQRKVRKFFETNQLLFIYKDTFIDGANKTNSVQEYTNVGVFSNLVKKEKKLINFFLRKGKLTDKYWISANQVRETFQMGQVSQYSEPSTKDYAFSGYLKLDDLKMKTSRTTFDLLSWLALVGGSLKSVKVICTWLVTAYVKRDFMNNVLGALFMVKKFDETRDERDEDVPITTDDADKVIRKSSTVT